MITLSRTWAIGIALLVSMLAVPLAFAISGSFLSNPSAALPVVLIIEFFIYFASALFSSPRARMSTSLAIAILLLTARALCSIFAGFAAALMLEGAAPSILSIWVGSIPSAVLQVLLLLISGFHLISALMPDLLEPDVRARLEGDAEIKAPAYGGRNVPGERGSPSGGFVQVFGYDELSGVIRKTPGLEGFVIYSAEGLVVWRDLPMRIELDSLVAKMLSNSDLVGATVEDAGLSRVRRIMVESRDHFVFTTALNSNFGLLLVFNSRVSTEEVIGRLSYIAKTAREFLQWKYPTLPVVKGLGVERKSLQVAG